VKQCNSDIADFAVAKQTNHLNQNLFHYVDCQPKSEVTSECSLVLVRHLNAMKLHSIMLYKNQCPQAIMCLLYLRCRKKKKTLRFVNV